MMQKILCGLAALALGVLAQAGRTTTVTFDDMPASVPYGTTYTENGFSFTSGFSSGQLKGDNGTLRFGPWWPDEQLGTFLEISWGGGQDFTLQSLEVTHVDGYGSGLSFTSYYAGQITGNFSTGGIGIADLSVLGVMDHLRIQAFNSPSNIDNLNGGGVSAQGGDGDPSAVPEPESWALFIAGFGAVGLACRGKRRRSLPA